MDSSNQLPLALKIAAITKELDNIKIVPVVEDTGTIHTVYVFKYGKWMDRLTKKCSKLLGNDITKTLSKNKDAKIYKFYPYTLGYIKKINKFVVCAEMKYKIK